MGDYTADLQDIRFVLFEQLDIDERLKAVEQYADFDHDTYDTMLEEARRLAEEVLSPVNKVGDVQGCKLDREGNVTTPDGFKAAWDAYVEGGWMGFSAPEEVGGTALPRTLSIATTEMFSGAATAFAMYPGLTAAAARMLHHFAAEPLKSLYAEKMFTGEWAGTMCLTESGAGSAVGDNRARATPTGEPGVYHLEGEKIFISGGDQDLSENIVHMVLARTPGAPEGTKGLSIFIVPKFLVDDEGNLGERNGAKVVGIEHKMGINGSATCTLALGTDQPCVGYLMGEEFSGMKIMFTMMNEARIGTGIQGMSLASAAYQNALSYAKERKQGPSLDNLRDPGAKSVAIVNHPDVRRMLMTQKCLVESMRSLVYSVGLRADLAENGDEEQQKKHGGQVDLLVPIVKAMCTDVGFECTVLAVQTFGGYGYTQEYPVEQHVRDAKICSIYEGTNGIQAMDLLGRKMRQKGGALFMEWLQEANERVATGAAAGFEAEAGLLGKAIGNLGATAMHLGGLGMQGDLAGAMLQASPFLRQFGWVVLGLESLDQAVVAKRLLDGGADDAHLRGKALNLRFYVNNVLPQAVALGKSITNGDSSCLDEILFA